MYSYILVGTSGSTVGGRSVLERMAVLEHYKAQQDHVKYSTMQGPFSSWYPLFSAELSLYHVVIIGVLGACEVPDTTPHGPEIRSEDPLFEAVYQPNITFLKTKFCMQKFLYCLTQSFNLFRLFIPVVVEVQYSFERNSFFCRLCFHRFEPGLQSWHLSQATWQAQSQASALRSENNPVPQALQTQHNQILRPSIRIQPLSPWPNHHINALVETTPHATMLETPETTATLARQLQETTGLEAIDLDRLRGRIEIERMAVLRAVAQEKPIIETGEEMIQEIQRIQDGRTVEMMGASAMMIETQETVATTVEEAETMVEDTREAEKTMRQRQEAGVRAATDYRR